MIHALVLWMGSVFSPEQYAFWTRIECTAWTVADFAIVLAVLRIGSLARRVAGRRGHRSPYLVLLATVPPAALIPFDSSAQFIFLLELAVTVPHFLILLYVFASDARYLPGLITTSAR